jgi:hypothetical protein
MKNFKTNGGPFINRPFYEDHEIDRICIQELQAIGLYPKLPEPVRIDRFIEKRFKVTPTYQELGDGILGLTKFGKNGVKEVIIAQALEEENSVVGERRIRSTLAHEAGHGLLHAHLFISTGQCTMFPDGASSAPKVLCRDNGHAHESKQYKGEWWEYHANRAIGSFLLPRQLLLIALEDYLIPHGLLGLKVIDPSKTHEAVKFLSNIFNVNPAVTKIRLNELFPDKILAQQVL